MYAKIWHINAFDMLKPSVLEIIIRVHNSIIKPWGYSGFARRIFLGERLVIECISKAFMCQILAYMIYNSPKFVYLLFNSCLKAIISLLRLNSKLRPWLARFFFLKYWKFCIEAVGSIFFLNVNKGQTLSHNQQSALFSSKRFFVVTLQVESSGNHTMVGSKNFCPDNVGLQNHSNMFVQSGVQAKLKSAYYSRIQI